MRILYILITVLWVAFWVYWLVSAASAKASTRTRRTRPPGLLAVAVLVVLRVLHVRGLTVHSPVLEAIGLALLVAGLGLAVWARVHLGRNWGMPMTERTEPELVTSGPYRFVRHPIYSGILLATIGTALAVTLYWLIVFLVLATYFIYSARVEERLMGASFPGAYAGYREKTKMLVPFLL